MRVLRSPAEVVALWTCPGFIPAFHYVYARTHVEQERKFKRIVEGGALLPAKAVGSQNMFLLDKLAGDDQYVFLSPVRPPQGLGGSTDFAFVFDAADLVRGGAVVGTSDFLDEYRDAVFNALVPRIGDDKAFTFAHTLQRGIKTSVETTINEIQPDLQYAVRYTDLSAAEAWALAIEAIESTAARRLNDGQAAAFLTKWAGRVCRSVRRLVREASDHVSRQSDQFRRLYRAETSAADGSVQACARAARDVMASDRSFLMTSVLSPPEILWPGPLPVEEAVAFIALPPPEAGRYYTGVDWLDDLFYLACPSPSPSALGGYGQAIPYRRRIEASEPPSIRALRFSS